MTSTQNPHGLVLDGLACHLTTPGRDPLHVLALDGRTGRVGLVPRLASGKPCPVSVPRQARAVDLYPVDADGRPT